MINTQHNKVTNPGYGMVAGYPVNFGALFEGYLVKMW
jgi:hypothetical protein